MLTIVDFIQVQRHPTTAVSTSVWTSNEFVCMRDFGWYIFLVCIKECGRRFFQAAEEFGYSNTYDTNSMLEVSHVLYASLWLGRELVYTHPISCWLTLFLPPGGSMWTLRFSAFKIWALFIHWVTCYGLVVYTPLDYATRDA